MVYSIEYNSRASRRHDWKILQYKTAAGRLPVEEVLARASDDDLAKIARKVNTLKTGGGLPPAPKRIPFQVDIVKRKGWKGLTLYVLKAKPTPYRLYLARPAQGQLLFLHVLVKKRWERKREEDDGAFDRLEKYISGEGGAVELPLPPG